jgi:hypothetical protein
MKPKLWPCLAYARDPADLEHGASDAHCAAHHRSDLINAICQQLRMETLCPTDDEDVPELVMFRAVEGRLCLSAISYFEAAAADRAMETFWQRVQAEAAPSVRKRKSA